MCAKVLPISCACTTITKWTNERPRNELMRVYSFLAQSLTHVGLKKNIARDFKCLLLMEPMLCQLILHEHLLSSLMMWLIAYWNIINLRHSYINQPMHCKSPGVKMMLSPKCNVIKRADFHG